MRLFKFGSQIPRLRNSIASGWVAATLTGIGLVSFGGQSASAERTSTIPASSYGASGASGKLSWTDSGCNGCHTPSRTFSHPVNKTPSMQVPSALPLQNGKMTCVTCHDDSSSALHARARISHDPMLRADLNATSMCAQCHTQSFSQASDAHAMAIGRTHTWEERSSSGVRRQDTGLSRGGVDAESQRCLECHDGSSAAKVGHQRTGDLFEFGANQEHPIGVEYRVKRGRDAAPMKPTATLDKRIRLFDGTVGCGSCHSLYSDQPKLLVMSNQRSALCLSCHDY